MGATKVPFRETGTYKIAYLISLIVLSLFGASNLYSLWVGAIDILLSFKVSFMLFLALTILYGFLDFFVTVLAAKRNLLRVIVEFFAIVTPSGTIAYLYPSFSALVLEQSVVQNLAFLPVEHKLMASFGIAIPLVFVVYNLPFIFKDVASYTREKLFKVSMRFRALRRKKKGTTQNQTNENNTSERRSHREIRQQGPVA